MGNSQNKEPEGFNPNFNMQEYNNKLNNIRHQYSHQQVSNVPGAYTFQAASRNMDCKEITRTVYIFKTTINIHITGNELLLEFEYHCPGEGTLQLAFGVTNIEFNDESQTITNIECVKSLEEAIQMGEKAKFSKSYVFGNNEMKCIMGAVLKIKLCHKNEASEYSLNYNSRTKLWKVNVENFSRGTQIFGIADIYGGGEEGQECIICMCEQSNVLVQPCNHLCLCSSCSKDLQSRQQKSCPICRKTISNLVTLSRQGE